MRPNSAVLLPWVLFIALTCAGQTPRSTSGSAKKQPGTADRAAEAARLNNLGAAYMNQQQFALALSLFRQAAVLNPKLEMAKVNQGIALENLQKYDQAAAVLNASLKRDPGNAHAWYTLGLVYKNQADAKKAPGAIETATISLHDALQSL